MSTKLNPNARKWVKALRSGKFPQARKVLGRDKNGQQSFCCLGVACEVYIKAGNKLDKRVDIDGNLEYNHYFWTLPKCVMKWLGLKYNDGSFLTGKGTVSLAMKNDRGTRFSTIADIIESQPEGLFTK